MSQSQSVLGTKYSSISMITTKKAQTNLILRVSEAKYNITTYSEMLSLLLYEYNSFIYIKSGISSSCRGGESSMLLLTFLNVNNVNKFKYL